MKKSLNNFCIRHCFLRYSKRRVALIVNFKLVCGPGVLGGDLTVRCSGASP